MPRMTHAERKARELLGMYKTATDAGRTHEQACSWLRTRIANHAAMTGRQPSEVGDALRTSYLDGLK